MLGNARKRLETVRERLENPQKRSGKASKTARNGPERLETVRRGWSRSERLETVWESPRKSKSASPVDAEMVWERLENAPETVWENESAQKGSGIFKSLPNRF